MKKLGLFNLSLVLLAASIITFAIVILQGVLIQRLELTLGLLLLPILLGAGSDITASLALVRKEGSKPKLIVTVIASTAVTVFIIFLTLMLNGLSKLT